VEAVTVTATVAEFAPQGAVLVTVYIKLYVPVLTREGLNIFPVIASEWSTSVHIPPITGVPPSEVNKFTLVILLQADMEALFPALCGWITVIVIGLLELFVPSEAVTVYVVVLSGVTVSVSPTALVFHL
jgi:hypothetical protein